MAPANSLGLDYETFSELNIKKVGAYAYARHPSTELLILCGILDDPRGRELDRFEWRYGEPMPKALIKLIKSGVRCRAFNAAFEWQITQHVIAGKMGWPDIPLEQWYCTQGAALQHALPTSLEKCASAFNKVHKKLGSGTRLITKFSKPRKVTKANAETRNYPEDFPEDFDEFVVYCMGDVEAERELYWGLPNREYSPTERQIWEQLQRQNDFGVRVDVGAVDDIMRMVEANRKRRLRELSILTEGAAKTDGQREVIMNWCDAQGYPLEGYTKDHLKAAIADKKVPKDVKHVLEIRQELGQTSLAKYPRIKEYACDDEVIRGGIVYHRASTGRNGGCLAEGTMILVKTASGEVTDVPIQDVTVDHKVYDGTDWVSHMGVVYSGEKDVIEYVGLSATPDHKVYLSDTDSRPFSEIAEQGLQPWRIRQGQKESRAYPSIVKTYDIIGAGPKARFVANGVVVSNSGPQFHNLPRDYVSSDERLIQICLDWVRDSKYEEIELVFGPLVNVAKGMLRPMLRSREGKVFYSADFSSIENRVTVWVSQDDVGIDVFANGVDQYRAFVSKQFGIAPEDVTAEQRTDGKATILGAMFGAGANTIWKTNVQKGIPMTLKQAKANVNEFREQYAVTAATWYELDEICIEACRLPPGKQVSYKGLKFFCRDNFFFMRLHSGRLLAYHDPKVQQVKTPWGAIKWAVTHSGLNSKGFWTRQTLTPSRIIENIVQAEARDLLMFSKTEVENEGFDLVLDVHDEVLAEQDPNYMTVEDFEAIMARIPDWAKKENGAYVDFPLKAEGAKFTRYRK